EATNASVFVQTVPTPTPAMTETSARTPVEDASRACLGGREEHRENECERADDGGSEKHGGEFLPGNNRSADDRAQHAPGALDRVVQPVGAAALLAVVHADHRLRQL